MNKKIVSAIDWVNEWTRRECEAPWTADNLPSWAQMLTHILEETQENPSGQTPHFTVLNLFTKVLSAEFAARTSSGAWPPMAENCLQPVIGYAESRLGEIFSNITASSKISGPSFPLLSRRENLKILKKFPAAARLAANVTVQIIENTLQVLEWLNRDIETLQRQGLFPGNSFPATLMELRPGLSDPHMKGKTVTLLCFQEGHRILCKPRSLKMDLAFQDLLSWLKEKDPQFSLFAPKTLDRGDHGWVEFLEPGEKPEIPVSAEQLNLFNYTQGVYLALFHSLQGSDFHNDNFLLRNSSEPVAVDLECLLGGALSRIVDDSVPDFLRHQEDSVLHTQMLPLWLRKPSPAGSLTQESIINICGMDFPGIQSEAQGTAAAISEGFRNTMNLLLRHRQELLSERGPLQNFKGLMVRLINRGTENYLALERELLTPVFLESMASFDRGLEKLNRLPVRLGTPDQFLEAEKRALWRLDIPVCHVPTDDRTIFLDGVQTSITAERDGFSKLSQFIHSLSPEHIQLQEKVISASLAMRQAHCSCKLKKSSPGPEELMKFSVECGEHLDRMAIEDHSGARWLGLMSLNSASVELYTLFSDFSLSSGASGTALFLANLAGATGRDRFAELALGALDYSDNFFRSLEELNCLSSQMFFSAFQGFAALAYAKTESGRCLRRPDLIESGVKGFLGAMQTRKASDIPCQDMMSGLAGTLLISLHLADLGASEGLSVDGLDDFARAAGQALINAQLPSGGWEIPGFKSPLLGIAHGAAGIAMALAKLWSRFPDQPILDSIERALDFEADHFDQVAGDWPNLQSSQRGIFMRGWCGGAPGAGMARLSMIESLGLGIEKPESSGLWERVNILLERLGREKDLAMKSCLMSALSSGGKTPPEGHHLCCGRSSLAWFLSEEPNNFSDMMVMNEIMGFYRQRGFLSLQNICAGPVIPGLMNGISGVGMAALKVYSKQIQEKGLKISNLLTLS